MDDVVQWASDIVLSREGLFKLIGSLRIDRRGFPRGGL